MKLSEVKPTADNLFADIQGVILNPNKRLTQLEVEIVAENYERLSEYEWLQFVSLYPAELNEHGVKKNAAQLAKTGRTVLEQAEYDLEQEILAEQAAKKGGATE